MDTRKVSRMAPDWAAMLVDRKAEKLVDMKAQWLDLLKVGRLAARLAVVTAALMVGVMAT